LALQIGQSAYGPKSGLFRKGRVLGLDFVEMTPAFDVNEISSITAGHIIPNFIGAAMRAGYFD
jgi:agmatinase